MENTSSTDNRRGSDASSILINLTDFVDFVSKSGRPKLTQVQTVKWRPEYDPQTDFWRLLRETIARFHRSGQTDKSRLDAVMEGITHEPKLQAYPIALKGYKKFLGRKQFQAQPDVRGTWDHGNLHVTVNPELALLIDGTRHVIKLYFRKEPLSKKHAEIILLMMQHSLATRIQPGTVLSLLDVQRAKLFTATTADQTLEPLLLGEAASFETMWNGLPLRNPRPRTRGRFNPAA